MKNEDRIVDIGILIIILLIIIGKFTGAVTWPWIWILAPVWIPFAFGVILAIILAIIYIVTIIAVITVPIILNIIENSKVGAIVDSAYGYKSAVDKYFVFEQSESSKEWIIIHNLNKKPSVTVVDTEDRVVIPYVQYISDNEIHLEFNAAFKGWAYLN